MVRVISQETFDQVVKENIEEFGLDEEEALKEAISQFESQGVNLANIITTGKKSGEDHAVEAALKALSLDESADENEKIKQCSIVKTECSKSLAEKMLATKADGYNILLKVALNKDHEKASIEAVQALAALLQANPDPFDEHGFAVIMQCFDQPSNSDEAKLAGLAMVQAVIVRHEQNRQNLVKNNILNILDGVFDQFPDKVAGIWMSLVQDDDVRVPYGKAHENARDIVENHDGLGKLIKVLKNETPDQPLLLACLRSLAVRNEYCQSVAELGGLDCLFDLLSKEKQSSGVVKEALLLLKALAGNDQLKKEIRASEKIGVIVSIMSNNMANKGICHAGSSVIGAICLRTPENAQQVIKSGGDEVLIQVLQTHMGTAKVAVAAVNAMRNIVSRSPELREPLVRLGIEELLHQMLAMHNSGSSNVSDSVKAAQRDLGLKVHLKEEWTGSGALSKTT